MLSACAGQLPGTARPGERVSKPAPTATARVVAQAPPSVRPTAAPAVAAPTPQPPPRIAPPPPAAITAATPPSASPAAQPKATPAAPPPERDTGPSPSVALAAPGQPAVTYMIPLARFNEVNNLERRPEVAEVLEAARRYPNSLIYLAGYVTEEDTRERHADPVALGDELVIQAGRHLAERGVDANRISGRGMGVNKTLGRAIVVSLDVKPRPETSDLNPRELAERAAAQQSPERQPLENRTFKQVAGLPSYRVGPGDVLKITSFRIGGAAEFAAQVSPLGTITFDLVENAPVGGLTTLEIESLLKSILKRYYRQPRIAVAVVTFASKTVTLILPTGTRLVPLAGRTTVFDLIVLLNLPTGSGAPGVADLKAIRVTRGTTDYQVNAFEIVQNHDWKQNLVLDAGDIVYMPTFTEIGDYVTVLGAVEKPGIYPMAVGLTASQALLAAGGAAKPAYLPHARIVRGDREHPKIIPADLDLVLNQGLMKAEKKLQGGDIIYVPKTRISDWNDFIADIRPSLEMATEPFRFLYFYRVFKQDF